jgi:hypothetical protein
MFYIKVLLSILAIVAIVSLWFAEKKKYQLVCMVAITLFAAIRSYFMGGPGLFTFVMVYLLLMDPLNKRKPLKPPDYDAE